MIDLSEEQWERFQDRLEEHLPRLARSTFERSTDRSLTRNKRLDYMKLLMTNTSIPRAYLTPEQLRLFGESVEEIATDPDASPRQLNLARRVLNKCSKYGLYAGR
jgi:hypothetical protein